MRQIAAVLATAAAAVALHAAPANAARPSPPSDCTEVDTKGNKTFDCDY